MYVNEFETKENIISTNDKLSHKAPRKRTLNIVGQQLPILLDVTWVGTPCCMLLLVVGSSCIHLHTITNMDTTTPNLVGVRLLEDYM